MGYFGGFAFGIKRSPLDDAVSEYVREKAGWTCERCLRPCPPRLLKGGRCGNEELHASHFYSRANQRIRTNPENIAALCRSCHKFMGENPHEHSEFFRKRLGAKRYEALTVLANTRLSTKRSKFEDKIEAAHWRSETKKLRQAREGVVWGRR